MAYVKLSFYLLAVVTTTMLSLTSSSRPGDKIHFQDSYELEELDTDRRTGPHRDNRNHRGRGLGHQNKHNNVPQFEEGIPGVYPIRGPPQAPLVLLGHPGRGVGLQNHKTEDVYSIPNQSPVQLPLGHHYIGNTFSSKTETVPPSPTTNKYNPTMPRGVTNQLPIADKPITTTPTALNPRRFDLLYGSNLLEESTKREDKVDQSTEVNFNDRGLFDTAPHCQPGQILVNNKCRLEV